MVLVAVNGLGVAAGSVAGGGAGAQQVLEFAARGVLGFGVAMVAFAPGDKAGSELQLPKELVEPRQLGRVGGVAWT